MFFGEGVPAQRAHQALAAIACSDAMLVVGSSLMVYSGYRFAKAMADAGKPIAAINLGLTRADDLPDTQDHRALLGRPSRVRASVETKETCVDR